MEFELGVFSLFSIEFCRRKRTNSRALSGVDLGNAKMDEDCQSDDVTVEHIDADRSSRCGGVMWICRTSWWVAL